MKNCSKCRLEKHIDLFSNDRRYSDGKYPSCKDCKTKVSQRYYQANKSVIIRKDVDRHLFKLQNDAYRTEHNKKCAEWNRNNPRREYHASYNRNRRKNDLNFKIAGNLRNRLYCSIRSDAKAGSAVDDLGCSISFLKKYLESLFTLGMSWDNYGKGHDKWNIDHIIPLASFDLTDRVQFLKACHYSNLQPLWEPKNLSKSDRLEF